MKQYIPENDDQKLSSRNVKNVDEQTPAIEAAAVPEDLLTKIGQLPLHTVLFAIFPIMALYAVNVHEATFGDAFQAMTTSFIAATILTVILGAFFPTRTRAAIATTWVIALFFTYGSAYGLNTYLARMGSPILLRDRYLLPVWNLAMLFGVYLFYKFDFFDERKVTRILNLFSIALFAISLMSVLSASWEGRAHEIDPTFAAISQEQIELQTPAVKRDVYYLVFDRYAGADILNDDFGHDNSEFLNALQERGFSVASDSKANYPKTEISMASALNMTYHQNKLSTMFYYREMLDKHRVGRLFNEQGYDYVHLGNPLDGLRKNSQAKANFRFSRMPTEFREELFRMTPLYAYFPATDVRSQVTQKLDLLKRTAKAPTGKPKFIYAHFLVPHNPWKFDADGESLSPSKAAERTERENYVNQLIYTNKQILDVVDDIVKVSKTPPVIIIQADEGPELRYENDQAKSDTEKIRERCSIVTAMYLPESGDTVVPNDLSPVNTFRLVFNTYFAAKMEMLENRSFYFSPVSPLGKPDWTQSGIFVDVTEQLRAPKTSKEVAIAE
ncbi:MAG: hypothetical protein ACI9HK_004387 [Pirellulaceae bacterium]|jgi:hypothetical protein